MKKNRNEMTPEELQLEHGIVYEDPPRGMGGFYVGALLISFFVALFWRMIINPNSDNIEILLVVLVFWVSQIAQDFNALRKNQVVAVQTLGKINNKINKEFENFWINLSGLLNIRDKVDEINDEIYGKDKRGW